jgi:FeS assembly SUF system protein
MIMERQDISNESLKEKIIEKLKSVYDPEIPVDVYELGLIYEVSIFPINNVYIKMTLTSPACPAAESLPGEIKVKVGEMKEVNDVEVEVTFDPPYSPDMMSETAKLELGFL